MICQKENDTSVPGCPINSMGRQVEQGNNID